MPAILHTLTHIIEKGERLDGSEYPGKHLNIKIPVNKHQNVDTLVSSHLQSSKTHFEKINAFQNCIKRFANFHCILIIALSKSKANQTQRYMEPGCS